MNVKGLKLIRRNDRRETILEHAEAFSMMKYQNKVTGRIEWIWNARDGVTPFTVDDPLCPEGDRARFQKRMADGKVDRQKEPDPNVMAHTDIFEDAFIPNYVPTDGTRIFMSWGEAPENHRLAVASRWKDLCERQRDAFGDQVTDDAIKGEPYGLFPEAPVLVVVTLELVEHFHELASRDPWGRPKAGAVQAPPLIMPSNPGFKDHTKILKL